MAKLEYVAQLYENNLVQGNIVKKTFYELLVKQWFPKILEKYKVSHPEKISVIFRYVYLYAKTLDDYVDGENIPPQNRLNSFEGNKAFLDEFLTNRWLFIREGFSSEEGKSLDQLISIALEYCDELNIPLREELEYLFISFLFDIERKSDILNGEVNCSSKKELEDHHFDYYGRGIHVPLAHVLGNEETSLDDVKDLVYGNRIYHDLSNFINDIRNGIVNIPAEEMRKYSITKDDIIKIALSSKKARNFSDIETMVSPNIWSWICDNTNKALAFLEEYESQTGIHDFKDTYDCYRKNTNLQDVLFYFGFESKCKPYLRKLSLYSQKNSH